MKQPVYCEFDLAQLSRCPRLIAVAHTDDTNVEQLELRVKQDGAPVSLAGAAVTARIVTAKENHLLSDNVACTVNESGNILIPFDNAVIHAQRGELQIEVNLTRGDQVLTLQFPLHVKFNGSILDAAEVTPESQGTIPELLEEAKEELARVEGYGDYNKLINKPSINGVTLSGNKSAADLRLQETLPQGNVNEIVAAASNGTMKRSGYSVTTNEAVIADRDSANGFVANARATAKAINLKAVQSAAVNVDGTVTFTLVDGSTITTTGESVIGADGASITEVSIRSGDLYITISDGSTAQIINVGRVRGENGVNGLNGAGYIAAEINASGQLVLTYQTAYRPGDAPAEAQVNLGRVVGANGLPGNNGAGIVAAEINSSGELVLTMQSAYPPGAMPNRDQLSLGRVVGADGNDYVLTAQDKTDIANIVLQLLPTTQGVLYGNASN